MSASNIPSYSPDASRLQQLQNDKVVNSTQSELEETEESDADEFEDGTLNAFTSSATSTFPMLSINQTNERSNNNVVSQGSIHISNHGININKLPASQLNQSRISLGATNKTRTPVTSADNQDQEQEQENISAIEAYFRRKSLGLPNLTTINKGPRRQPKVLKKTSKTRKRNQVLISAMTGSSSTIAATTDETMDRIEASSSRVNDNNMDDNTSSLAEQRRRELTAEERNYIYGINDGIAMLMRKCEETHKNFEQLLTSHKKLQGLKKSDIAELLKRLKAPRLSGADLAEVSGFKYETYKTTLRRRRIRMNGHSVKRSGRRKNEDKELEESVNDGNNSNI